MQTVEEQWKEFAEKVFGKTPISQTQYNEMKKAFFAGAWVILCAVKDLGSPDKSEELGIACLQSWEAEVFQFHRDVLRRHAENN